jgi:hypothetical protein
MFHDDDSFGEWSAVQATVIMELLEVFMKNKCFEVDDKFF